MRADGEKSSIRIVLVEDDVLDAELVLDELRADGLVFESRLVDDETAYRDELEQFSPDIVLCDMSLPGFSGYRAMDLLREVSSSTPFIFVSGTIGEEAAIEALHRGATDYVLKSGLSRLPSVVRRALRETQEQAARERAETELLRAQRFESLAMLAGGLSHDLRNILQPLLLSADAIKGADDPELRKHGSLVADCAKRGLEMVASMLSFARGARVEVERVKLSALFSTLSMLLRGSVPRNVQLEMHGLENDVAIEGNHTELQQCLLNLSLNGLQAMPNGGSLKLWAEPVTLDEDFFAADETPSAGSFVRLIVADSGTGMSEQVRANLFKPFFTTKSDGTGLGLLSVRRIVTNHRGYLRVHSEPGKGTRFALYFPVPTAQRAPESQTQLEYGRGETVLIVVERVGKRTMLFDSLDLNGYAAITAGSGTEAILKIDQIGLPDLLIMDADMSLMTGVRTLDALLERNYRGPLLMLVRKDAQIDYESLPPVERIRFIEKPVSVPLLLQTVREELDLQQSNVTA
jgi:signal transduction histidine kinase